MNHLIWVLRTKPRSCKELEVLLTPEPSLQPPATYFLDLNLILLSLMMEAAGQTPSLDLCFGAFPLLGAAEPAPLTK